MKTDLKGVFPLFCTVFLGAGKAVCPCCAVLIRCSSELSSGRYYSLSLTSALQPKRLRRVPARQWQAAESLLEAILLT